MKNYWLERKDTTIAINQVGVGNPCEGRWYIAKNRKLSPSDYSPDWTVWPEDVTFYLHSDGKWRTSTVNEDNKYTGYFDSKEDAEKVLYNT